jgi:hypothetical protein
MPGYFNMLSILWFPLVWSCLTNTSSQQTLQIPPTKLCRTVRINQHQKLEWKDLFRTEVQVRAELKFVFSVATLPDFISFLSDPESDVAEARKKIAMMQRGGIRPEVRSIFLYIMGVLIFSY